jgi:hypothetical protein
MTDLKDKGMIAYAIPKLEEKLDSSTALFSKQILEYLQDLSNIDTKTAPAAKGLTELLYGSYELEPGPTDYALLHYASQRLDEASEAKVIAPFGLVIAYYDGTRARSFKVTSESTIGDLKKDIAEHEKVSVEQIGIDYEDKPVINEVDLNRGCDNDKTLLSRYYIVPKLSWAIYV